MNFNVFMGHLLFCYLVSSPKTVVGSCVPITRLSWALDYKTYTTSKTAKKTGVNRLSPEELERESMNVNEVGMSVNTMVKNECSE